MRGFSARLSALGRVESCCPEEKHPSLILTTNIRSFMICIHSAWEASLESDIHFSDSCISISKCGHTYNVREDEYISSVVMQLFECVKTQIIPHRDHVRGLQQRFSECEGASPGGLQTVSGEAQWIEVKKYYISYQKEITYYSLKVCSLGEFYCFSHFPRVRN